MHVSARVGAIGFLTATLGGPLLAQQQPGFSFRTSVDLISVNATVTDASGHFVPGLRAEDFVVYEDGERQAISQFETERVPVSLGIVLDTSGSMAGEKIAAAQTALSRFVFDLLGPRDEMFLYRFDSEPTLVQGWTEDRRMLVRALGSVRPSGGTALYDSVVEAIPLATAGSRRKKALVILSDGNDTHSMVTLADVQHAIRPSEVMVYAIGIGATASGARPQANPPRIPWPGGNGGPIQLPWPRRPPAPSSPRSSGGSGTDRVNVAALRSITDDSGGRTEIVQSARDLDAATAGIASELSQQYFLGYVSNRPKDGRWHQIEVRLANGKHTVRARRGFVAS